MLIYLKPKLYELKSLQSWIKFIGDSTSTFLLQVSLATSSSEPSPEPLFDMHDIHGQAALHVAARLGQAQVVKVRFMLSPIFSNFHFVFT